MKVEWDNEKGLPIIKRIIGKNEIEFVIQEEELREIYEVLYEEKIATMLFGYAKEHLGKEEYAQLEEMDDEKNPYTELLFGIFKETIDNFLNSNSKLLLYSSIQEADTESDLAGYAIESNSEKLDTVYEEDEEVVS